MPDERNIVVKKLKLFTNFTESERSDLAGKLAEMNISISELEAEKKAISSRIGDEIKEIEANASTLSKKVHDNGEEREIKCTIAYNFPELGKKSVTREDTGETWIEAMNDEDYSLFREESNDQEELTEEEQKTYCLPPHEEAEYEEINEDDPTDGSDEIYLQEISELYGIDAQKLADNLEGLNFFTVTTEAELEQIGFDNEAIEISFAKLRGALIVNVSASTAKAFSPNSTLPKNYIGEFTNDESSYVAFSKLEIEVKI